jgi:hypothetical protein
MSAFHDNVLIGSSAPTGYNLTNSLRFRSSASAYLNRTPASAGNRQIWTWSGFVKRGSITNGSLFGADGSNYMFMYFTPNSLDCGEVVGSQQWRRITTQVFRDPSAWYHIVFAFDSTQATAGNRVKLYVNGTQVTAFSTSADPTLNYNSVVNTTVSHSIGSFAAPTRQAYLDGYLTEINFIDGQALTPSSFGEFSATTGVWQPKRYTGTYGTNGFYLPFTDNSALTTSSNVGLGRDYSGNGNYWTTNNISITAGTTYDSMTDVPTLTNATTANYCVLNPLDWVLATNTITNGNLNITTSAANLSAALGTLAVSSGKWYFEFIPSSVTGIPQIGIVKTPVGTISTNGIGQSANAYVYLSNGNKGNNNSFTSYGATYTNSDVIGVALDLDAGTLVFYKNNTSQGTAFTGLSGEFFPVIGDTGGASTIAGNINFGQRPFAYSPPTGFNRLNTFNLPTPAIGATASTLANKNMDVSLYTGTGSAQSITNSGSMQPDFVWIKNRSNTGDNGLVDSVRGRALSLYSNLTDPEFTSGSTQDVTSFNSNGFSLGTQFNFSCNASGNTYVGWQWRANGAAVTNTAGSISSQVSANTSAGFSVVTFTSDGTTAGGTVGHGLGVAPSMVIYKGRNTAENWFIYHVSLGGSNAVFLNLTNASTSTGTFNSTTPTSSVIQLRQSSWGASNLVAYCFAPVAGYSAFGSYTGNGSADGTFVFTGFRPRFVLVKRTDSTSSWGLIDTARDTYNVTTKLLFPNASDAENTSYTPEDILSNGFKLRDTTYNISSGTYIYMAFAESPFKYANAR